MPLSSETIVIESFYADILPEGSQHICATINHNNKKIQHYVKSTLELIPFLSEQNLSTYHSLGAYQGLTTDTDDALHELKNLSGCTGVKAWGFDLDVGKQEGKYDTLEQAAQDLGQAVESGVLPQPSWILNSGGGLQFYLSLEQTIAEEDWVSHFGRLRRYLKDHLKLDPTVGSRPYKLLRSPCTANYKYRPARPVQILMEGPHITLDYLESLPDTLPERTTPDTGETEPKDYLPIKQIVRACPAMLREFKTRGKKTPYERWFAVANICAHTYRGRKNFHLFSDGHPEYDENETDDKYDEVKRNATDGPAGCDFFGNKIDPDSPCYKCRYKDTVKNPVHAARKMLGVKKTSKPESEDDSDEEVVVGIDTVVQKEEEVQDYISYLSSFGIDGGLGRYTVNLDGWENGAQGKVADPFYFRTHRFNPKTNQGSVEISRDRKLWMAVSTEQLSSPQRLAAVAIGLGIAVVDDLAFTRIVRQCTLGYESGIEQGAYGWSPGFDNALLPSGSVGDTEIFPSVNLRHLHDKWSGKEGTFDSWLEAVQIYNKPGQEPYLVALLTSLASPLMSYYHLQKGVIYSLTGPGGAGKTSAMQVATSAWGKPIETVAGLASTYNSFRLYMRLCGNLPMVIDDLTQMPAEDLKQMALEISQGTGRERMIGSDELATGESWYLTFLTTTNKRLHDRLAQLVDAGKADMDRVIEIPVEISRYVSAQQGQQMLDVIRQNHGHAGEKLLEVVSTLDRDREVKAVREFSDKLTRIDGLQGSDRFVRDLIVSCYQAHKIMKQIDERFPGEPKDILQWMRLSLRENNRYIAEVLDIRIASVDDFLMEYAADGLILGRQSNGTYPAQGPSMKGYLFDEGDDSLWFILPKETLTAWCRRQGLKLSTIIERWSQSGRLYNFSHNVRKKRWVGRLDKPIICDGLKMNPQVYKLHKGTVAKRINTQDNDNVVELKTHGKSK